MTKRGRRYMLLANWTEHPPSPSIGWTAQGGSTFTYIDDVAHFDWFQALVAFDEPVLRKDGTEIAGGTTLRCGWGITNTKFSIPVDDDAETAHAQWCEDLPSHSVEHCPHKDIGAMHPPHPAQCPFCGGRHVNAVIPDLQLRDARLNDDGTLTISDDTDGYADWDAQDMLFCHTCSSTYLMPDDVKVEYEHVKVEIPVTSPRRVAPGYIGADVKWTPEVVFPPESRIDFVDFAPDPMEYYA